MDSNTPRDSLDRPDQNSDSDDDVTVTSMAAVDVTYPKEVATSENVRDIALQAESRVVVKMAEDRDGSVNIGNNISNTHNHFTCRRIVQNIQKTTVINNYGDPGTNTRQNQFTGVGSNLESNASRFHYVQTPDLEEAADILQERGRVVLCGSPGSGKTTLAHALLDVYQNMGYQAHTIAHVQELMGCIREGGTSIVLMDGVLGEVRVDRREYKALRSVLRPLLESVKAGTCFLVFTVYPHVLRELRALDTPLFDSTSLVQIPTYPLHEDDKTAMITSHLQELDIDTPEQDALVREILQKDVSGAAFPWCCRQMVNKWHSMADRTLFFTAPAEAHVPLILRMLRDPEHGETMAAVLSLTMLGSGRFLHNPCSAQPHLKTLGFRDFSDCRLEEYADVLKESILNKLGNAFDNRVMYDAAGIGLGRTIYQPVLLKVCDVQFLAQHMRTTQPATEFSVTIDPTPEDPQLPMQTMYKQIVSGRLPELCQHPSLHCPQFLHEFEAFCRANKNYMQRLVSAVDPVHKMPLLYWSVWGPTGNLTDWCLKLTDGETDRSFNNFLLFSAAFAHALVERQSDNKGQEVMKIFNTLLCNPAMRDEEDIYLPLPSEEQCFQPTLKAVRDHTVRDIQAGPLCYLGDPSIPIPRTLVSMQVTTSDDGDKVRVVVPRKHLYLALRLLTDRQVDETDDEGNTLLHVAADTGDVDAVKIAVKSGASLTATNNRGQTPLQLAATRETKWKEKILESDTHPLVALDTACSDGNLEKIKVLLCTSASTHCYSINALLVSSCIAGQTDVAAFFVSLDADINERDDSSGYTPLHHACMRGDTCAQIALLLIQNGADVNLKENDGYSPLHHACRGGQTATALLLVQHHADVNAKSNEGFTPLHLACKFGETKAAELLIQHQADVNALNNLRYTPLHLASGYGRQQAVLLLLQHGANVNVKDKSGNTPLDRALLWKKKDVATLLIEHGATVEKRWTMKRLEALRITVPEAAASVE